MNYTIVSDEVLYTNEPVTRVSHDDIQVLKTLALRNSRRRIRLCAHPGVGDGLHEMIIVHAGGTYIRPHKHVGKSESFHIIEGRFQVVLFEEDGRIRDVVNLGHTESGANFYYRLSESWFHTVIPMSEVVVFHETTNGPFRPEDAVFAPWAPQENDHEGQKRYLDQLRVRQAERFPDR